MTLTTSLPHRHADDSTDYGGYCHRKSASEGDSQRCTNEWRPAEMTAERTETRETHQRERCDRGDTQSGRRDEESRNRNRGEGRKARGRYPRSLHRTREGCLADP